MMSLLGQIVSFGNARVSGVVEEVFILLSKSFLQHDRALTSIVILVLHSLNFVHLNSPFLDNVSLLADAESFQIIKANAHLVVKVAGKESSCIHIVFAWFVVPKPLMILFFHWKAPYILCLFESIGSTSPSRWK